MLSFDVLDRRITAYLPAVTCQPGRIPYAPTIEGQYIIKNQLIISAALAVGGRVPELAEL
jgi:hypothetical protein